VSRYSRIRKHKLQSQVTAVDGVKFQSAAEARRYGDLLLMLKAEKIAELKVHPRFKIEHNGVKICTVVLDFSYIDRSIKSYGVSMIRYEDVKVQKLGKDGKIAFTTDTRHSKIGRKLLKAFHGIDVDLVYL
jgi:hypothetical protein